MKSPATCSPIPSSRTTSWRSLTKTGSWNVSRSQPTLSMKFAVIRFPGSNCDQDCVYALNNLEGASADYVWHKERLAGRIQCRGGARRFFPMATTCAAERSPALADHDGGEGVRRRRRLWSSASATDFKFCANPGCCRGHWSAIAISISCANTSRCGSNKTAPLHQYAEGR